MYCKIIRSMQGACHQVFESYDLKGIKLQIFIIFGFLTIGILSTTISKSLNVHEIRTINAQLDGEFERYVVLDNENIRIKNLLERDFKTTN